MINDPPGRYPSRLLGLTPRRLRQVGAAGGLWTFDADQVRTEAALRQEGHAG